MNKPIAKCLMELESEETTVIRQETKSSECLVSEKLTEDNMRCLD